MRTLLLIACIWTMSFVAAFASEGKNPLVKVYCEFTLSEKNFNTVESGTLGTFEERWDLFTSYLKNRESFIKISEQSEQKAEFDTCVSKNREIFERGEFALSGLESIEETKALLSLAPPSSEAPVLIASNIHLLDREISTPDMEVVYGFIPDEPSPEIPLVLLENGVSSRQERYTALWNEFVAGLKESYSMQQEVK